LYNVVRLQSPKDHKNDNDDQDGAKDTDATVTEAITVPAETAAEATEQENNEDDDEDSSKRHILSRRAKNIGTAEEPVLDRAIALAGAQSWGDGEQSGFRDFLDLPIAARRIGVPALNLWACDHAAS
jgi:hypothetical protein